MRPYGQYCAVAKALDAIGERWSLLIVRELLLRGPCRYTDLLDGLPGIATNLLAQRLRTLEQAGVIRREAAAPPVATTLFRLTPRGEALKPVLAELGRWGAPLMAQPSHTEAFRSAWLTLPVELYLSDRAPQQPPVRVVLDPGDEPVTVEACHGEVRVRPGAGERPDLVLAGTPQLVLGVLVGALPLREARSRGLRHEGDSRVLRRLRPEAAAARP